jgi:hypothetical protein
MPQRTNTFQQVVRLVHEHLAADGASVKESHMLVDEITGEDREVDVTLVTEVAGHEIVLSIEATTRKRPADAKWVEGEIAKHESLATNKLVLVSGSGFTKGARVKVDAQNGKVVALTPEEIETDPERVIVSRLGIVVAKTVKIWHPEELVILIRLPDGEVVQAHVEDGDDAVIFTSDGTEQAVVSDEIRRRLKAISSSLPDELGISDEPQTLDTRYRMGLHGWTYEVTQPDGGVEDLDGCLQWKSEANNEVGYTPIADLLIGGRIEFDVAHVSLSHMQLGGAAASYGRAALADGEGLVVVTEDKAGDVRASLRAPDGLLADLSLDESLKRPS